MGDRLGTAGVVGFLFFFVVVLRDSLELHPCHTFTEGDQLYVLGCLFFWLICFAEEQASVQGTTLFSAYTHCEMKVKSILVILAHIHTFFNQKEKCKCNSLSIDV